MPRLLVDYVDFETDDYPLVQWILTERVEPDRKFPRVVLALGKIAGVYYEDVGVRYRVENL